MENFEVIIWDKQADEPYHKIRYEELEVAQQVARNMKRHYIDDWGEHAESIYEVRLLKHKGQADD